MEVMERLASFSGAQFPLGLKIMALAQYGFYHTRNGQLLQCSRCSSIVEADRFVSSPTDRKYHSADGCYFALTGEDAGSACSIAVPATPTTGSLLKSIASSGMGESGEDSENYLSSPTKCRPGTVQSMKYYGRGVDVNHCHHDSSGKEIEWIDGALFNFQAGSPKPVETCLENFTYCEENAQHSNMTKPSEMTKGKLPQGMENFASIEEKLSKMVFKVRVGKKSAYRPQERGDNDSCGKVEKCDEHIGSGSGFLDCEDRHKEWLKESDVAKGILKPSTPGFHFTVLTNTHVVYDNFEARTAVVECFYDSEDREGIVSATGVAVKQCHEEGDYRAYLICKTGNKDFVKWLCKTRNDVRKDIEKIEKNVEEDWTHNSIVISHPHGCSKRISVGKCSVTKYGLKTNAKDHKIEMVHCSDSDKDCLADVKDKREILLYTASTCPGSSGSPVYTFRKSGEDECGNSLFKLCIWVHNGIEKSTKLGSSIMKSVDPSLPNEDEILPLPEIKLKLTTEQNKKPQESAPNAAVVKRGIPPLYQEYFSVLARLATYGPNYKSKCPHTPVHLALSGFFFTGIGDCIRCFYCGQGLKAWRSTDNVFVEHQKARPNCGFLKVCLELKEVTDLEILKKDPILPPPKDGKMTPSLTCSLLERENKYLQQQQLCKMCFRRPARELFLPCREIHTCEECAAILSKCPVCDVKIDATITVYIV